MNKINHPLTKFLTDSKYFNYCHRMILLIALWFLSCARHQIVNKPQRAVEEQFQLAMNNFQAKHYDKAIAGFSDIIFNYPGSRYAADAQYYLARTYLEKRDYLQAIVEFDFFLKNFPTSPYLEPAMVELALAYLRSAPNVQRDQSQLLKAQELLEAVAEKFPNSKYQIDIDKAKQELIEKLAQKEFEAANLYFRAQEFEAAKIYYEHILTNYKTASFAQQAKLPLAICYLETGGKSQAKQLLEEMTKDTSNPKIQKKALAQLKKLD